MKVQILTTLHILLIVQLFGQQSVYAIRNYDYLGYTIIKPTGEVLFELPYNSEPIFDNVMRSGGYPNAITIPLNNDNLPVKYGDKFYIININGSIINKLHPQTEWVHNWNTPIPRVSLINYPNLGSFKDIFIDNNGNQLFNNEIFDDADNFIGEYAPVKRSRTVGWTLIDKFGKDVLDIQSMINEDFENLYNSFQDIWSFRNKLTYKEIFVTKSGLKSESLSNAIYSYHGFKIEAHLLKNNAILLSDFLLSSSDRYILLRSTDKEGNMTQELYDRHLNKIDIAKPDTNGKYYFLKSNKDYIFGTYEHENKQKESIIIDAKTNKIIFRSKEIIQNVIDNHVLCYKDSKYRLVDLQNNLVFESHEPNYLTIKDDFDSIIIPEKIKIVEIFGLKGNKIPPNILQQLKNIQTLVLIECRELESLDPQNFPNLENLGIKRCNMLENFEPWQNNFLKLKTYTNGIKTYFNNTLKLTVSNK